MEPNLDKEQKITFLRHQAQPAVVVAPAVLRAGEVDPLWVAEPRTQGLRETFLKTLGCQALGSRGSK